MFEVSYTEVALLVWALIATVKWLAYKADFQKSVEMLRVFVEDPVARGRMLDSYEAFKKRVVNN